MNTVCLFLKLPAASALATIEFAPKFARDWLQVHEIAETAPSTFAAKLDFQNK